MWPFKSEKEKAQEKYDWIQNQNQWPTGSAPGNFIYGPNWRPDLTMTKREIELLDLKFKESK